MTAADLRPRIVLLPGDGIGPEIVAAARRVLEAVGEFEITEQVVGGASIDLHGTALADEVRRLEEDNDALRAQRDELHEAVQTLASQMTRTADEILHRFGTRRRAPGDLASR